MARPAGQYIPFRPVSPADTEPDRGISHEGVFTLPIPEWPLHLLVWPPTKPLVCRVCSQRTESGDWIHGGWTCEPASQYLFERDLGTFRATIRHPILQIPPPPRIQCLWCKDSSCLTSSSIGERLKGSLLKGSLDKSVRIDLPPTLPTPSPFASFATGKPPPTTHLNPTPKPSPRDTSKNSHPFAKTTPGKTTA